MAQEGREMVSFSPMNKIPKYLTRDKTPRKLKGRKKPLRCLRCSYEWTHYGKRKPTRCARCGSPYWQTPPRRQRAEDPSHANGVPDPLR